MTDDIKSWLTELGLAQYAKVFAANDVDFDILSELDDADLQQLGLSLGDRKRLRRAIGELGQPGGDSEESSAGDDAERRQLTVMFCDLVGSTKLSVRMDPEELREIISLFQKRCEQVVKSFGGNVARYMGDGLLVYFGYPRADENDPEFSIRAGLEIINVVRQLVAADGVVLQTRVGIATGEVVVGDLIGAGSARERAVVGETPNLAARLQGLAEPDQVVVSDATRKRVRGLFELSDLGQHTLKGFYTPVPAWRVGKELAIESRFEAIHPVAELTPLVSRAQETEQLMNRWSAALAGNGQAVLVSGEAGIGKSRLVHTLRERLAAVPHTLLRYFCVPYYQNTALFPMMRRLESAAGIAATDSATTKLEKLEQEIEQSHMELADAAPFFAALLSIPTGDRYPELNLSPQRWMERTLHAFEQQLAGLSRDLPVLVLFEDLHWIDPTTLELLHRMVQKVSELPVLLVMTTRPGFEPPWQDTGGTTSIHLNRLLGDDGATLAAQVTAGKALPAEVIQQIVQKTDGIPLFIEELTRTVMDSDLLEERDGAYVLTRPLSDLALPGTLQDLLMARLDQLAGAKELAQIGATIGRQFPYKLLSAVSKLNPRQLQDAIGKLISTDVVFGKGELPDTVYTFRHALIQDSAYLSLLKKKRKTLHHQIAEALESQYSDIASVRPETLAHHYTRADEYEKAIVYWHRAANLATDRATHVDAIEHVSKALELLATLPVDERHREAEIGLRVTLGRNQEATLGYASAEVEQTFARARDLCQELGATTEQVPVLLGLCVFNLVRAKLTVCRDLAEHCVQIAEDAGNIDYQIESWGLLAFAFFYMGSLAESRDASEKCVALYASRHRDEFSQVTAQNPAVCALYIEAIALWLQGYPDKSLECIDKAFSLAEELGHPINVAQIHTHAAELRQLRGEPEKAKEHAQAAIGISAEHGYDTWQLMSTVHLGIAMGVLGERLEALAMTGEVMALLGGAGADINLPYFLGGVAQIHLTAGDADKGLTLLDRALQQAERASEKFHVASLHILRGECRQHLHDHEGAESDFQRAIELATEQNANMVRLRAACRLYSLRESQGREQTARQMLDESLALITEGFDTADVGEARALLGQAT